jgi:ATP-dependent Lon protease
LQEGELYARGTTLPERLPILPLGSIVVFPSAVAALQIGDRRNLELLASLDENTNIVGLFSLHRSKGGTSEPENLASIGVAAEVVQHLKLGPKREQILCRGVQRIELHAVEQTEPFWVGRVEPVVVAPPGRALQVNVLLGKVISAFENLVAADRRYDPEMLNLLKTNVEYGPDFFSDLLANLLNIPLPDKQSLVEEINPVARLRLLVELIEQEIARVAVDSDIDGHVKARIEEKKRQYLLREQMRAIQEALGEDQGPRREAEEYSSMIEHLPIDDDCKQMLERECERLALMSQHSPEYAIQSTYLDTVFRLPWWEKSPESLNLRKVERLLSRRHFGLEEVKERVLEYLSVVRLKGQIGGPILCLAGPPGTGKTSLGRSIAEALGRSFANITLGGVSDESEIRGHRKTYIGAMPGKVIAAYDQVGSRNPVILLDEIDKLSKSMHGDPASALLEVLDPEQNHHFVDHYLGIPFDLSDTLFIATANLLEPIPPPLRDRLEILRLPGYSEYEKLEIGRRFLRPKLLAQHGLDSSALQVSRDAYVGIIRNYTAEAGVRELERQLATICRKVARRHARTRQKKVPTVRVRGSSLTKFLGQPIYAQEFAGRNPEVGVATGLAWSAVGGSILFIEASRMAGSGNLQITGHLGEVMQESVRAAYSYVRSHARRLEISTKTFEATDVHIHLPAGATPKDGPSAGVAVATCLASLLSCLPVRHDVAMTGEITLRGKILSVGGIREKLLAAHRSRIKVALLPIGNLKDLEEVPQEVLDDLEIVFIDRIEEAWERSLMPVAVPNDSDLKQLAKPARAVRADRLAADGTE